MVGLRGHGPRPTNDERLGRSDRGWVGSLPAIGWSTGACALDARRNQDLDGKHGFGIPTHPGWAAHRLFLCAVFVAEVDLGVSECPIKCPRECARVDSHCVTTARFTAAHTRR